MKPNTDNNTQEASSTAPAGYAKPRWGLGEAADKQMELMEAILRRHDAAVEHSFAVTKDAEAKEIVEEGVEHFMAASAGVAPQQKLMVGVKYCLGALKEWRKRGPEGASHTEKLIDTAS